MNCDWVKNNGVLMLYDELGDDVRHELEQHLAKCKDCSEELATLRGFHALMTRARPVADPSPNLLAASRMRLQEALEHEQQKPSWKLTLDIAQWFYQLRFQPALAAMLLMVGFTVGAVTAFVAKKPGSVVSDGGSGKVPTTEASIGPIRSITQDPTTNQVQVLYDRMVPDQKSGSMNDPEIQQLLLYAARNNYNSGVRLDSVTVLADDQQATQDQNIREALIFALRYDKNPGVRLKALAGLKAYVRNDMRVRDAILEALLRDSNPGIRTEAIRSLGPVTADSSVRATLQALAERDQNTFIRNESRRVLATLPDIQ